MSFSFNDGVPAAPDNPSVDQPIMLQNNVSNQGIWAVDHIGFNAANGGQHQWTQFPITSSFPTPPTPTGMSSVAFPGAGVANPAAAQYFYQNSQVTTQLSCVRAWALCSTGGIIATQSVNVMSVTRTGTGNYSVVLTANAVTSSNFAVLVSGTVTSNLSIGVIAGYAITGIGTFQINFAKLNGTATTDPTNFSFAVLQL